MLSRPEGGGGVKTVKLARGPASASTRPARPTPSRKSSVQNDCLFLQESASQDTSQLLTQIGLLEFLQYDGRPTFVIDLEDISSVEPDCLNFVFANVALKTRPGLLEQIRCPAEAAFQAPSTPSAFVEFKRWAYSSVEDGESEAVWPSIYSYAASVWSSTTLRNRLRVIACTPNRSPPALIGSLNGSDTQYFNALRTSSSTKSRGMDQESTGYFDQVMPRRALCSPTHAEIVTSQNAVGPLCMDKWTSSPESRGSLTSLRAQGEVLGSGQSMGALTSSMDFEASDAIPNQGFFDSTRLPEASASPPHIRFARGVDWAATSLGPIEGWDANLRAMCNMIMASPHPAAMYWGPDLISIYNEAYILLAGNKHPTLMGQSYKEAWLEIWDAVKDVFANAHSNAQATMKDDDCLFLNRNGFYEETYFSWSIIPLIGNDGSVVGLYNPAFEKTRRKIAERRMLTLREVGERTAAAREVSKFWPLLLQGLEYNELDAPFVLIYSVADDLDSDNSSNQSSSMITQRVLVLEGSLGVPRGHEAAPEQIDLSSSMRGFAPFFRTAVKTEKPIILSERDGTLDSELLKGIQWRGYGDPSSTVVVFPIRPTPGESTLGFVVMGTNPRRPFDEDYDLFVQLLARQLATSVASVVLFEEEIRKGERAARLAAEDRIELSKQLAARTQEAAESELKFTRMAELAPVGMFIADPTGRLNYCNDTWYELSSYPKSMLVGEDWMDYVTNEDKNVAARQWCSIIDDKEPVSAEFRFKTPWQDREGNRLSETWVLASTYPEKGSDGHLKRIFGSVTDISAQKFAEEQQKRRMEEAVELKRQQENFIDITSHEMRNPLSAILQCADDIVSSSKAARGTPELQSAILDSNIDAAQTITLCAQHQKRIVDDVLTLSKLDSARLLVTPVDVQPSSVVHRAIKMFEGELQTADISLDFRVDDSLHALHVNWVRIDPSRLLQVLINLITNAIKFTTTQEKRSIIVCFGASLTRPSEQPDKSVDYVPSRSKEKDTTAAPEWGKGDLVYLTFAIQDTGRGLTDSEKKLLFLRYPRFFPAQHIPSKISLTINLGSLKPVLELTSLMVALASDYSFLGSWSSFKVVRLEWLPKVAVVARSPFTSGPDVHLCLANLANIPSMQATSGKDPARDRCDPWFNRTAPWGWQLLPLTPILKWRMVLLEAC